MEDIRFQPRWNTKAVATSARMKEVTIRKYCSLLESAGYTFTRINDRGDRRYTDVEIEMLIEMRRLSDESDMDIAHIAEDLAQRYKRTFVEESRDVPEPRVPTNDLETIVAQAGRQFWSIAKEELRETVREEVRTELDDQVEQLKLHISEELRAVRREVAASREQPRRWWRFGR